MRIHIETYGCSANQAESEMMAGLLEKAGYEMVDTDSADIVIVNSCIVKEPTEHRLLSRLGQIRGKLIITGCGPEGIYDKIADAAPAASMVSTHHISGITQAVGEVAGGKRIEMLGETREVKLGLPKIRKSPVTGIVPIASGCNSACAYCCVRLAKGELFSYPKEQIIEEVTSAVNQGCTEIWITSQDNSCYGFDTGRSLPDLLNSLSRIDGKFLVRIGMMNPKNAMKILPELIESYESEKIYKFLHLPIQSGSDEILEKMNRGYTAADFKRIVHAFRERFPALQLWTDVIVGFPGETDADFLATTELLKEIRPDYVNISRYGPRENTASAKLKQPPTEIKKERSRIVTELAKEIALEKNKKWQGWEGDVLVVENKGDVSLGRNFAYKPILINSDKIGEFVKAKIVDVNLSGRVL